MSMPAKAEDIQPSATGGMMEQWPAAEMSFMATAQDTSEIMGIFLLIHKVPYKGMVPTEMSDTTHRARREEKHPEHTECLSGDHF
jgi:hypothetical protein